MKYIIGTDQADNFGPLGYTTTNWWSGTTYHPGETTNEGDLVSARGGNDQVNGGGGDDFVLGGDGNDTLNGADGDDHLYGEAGDDNLFGANDDDTLLGGADNDEVSGGDGADSLWGDEGVDVLDGGNDNDVIRGGADGDTLIGGNGTDTASYFDSDSAVTVSLVTNQGSGGDAQGDTLASIENLEGSYYGADSLTGDGGANVLTGLGGDDLLKGAGGADTLHGNSGNDSLNGGDGADAVYGGTGTDTLKGGGGTDTLNGGWDNDTVQGGDDNDWLYGEHGSDTLYGENGHDIIDGGDGADTMIGGYGNDTYYVGNGDVVTESGGQGTDEVRTSVSWTLTPGADVETLRTTNDAGLGAINLTGNASGNIIRGNAGDNVLNGGGGNDYLTGLGGQDTYLFNTPLNVATNVDVIVGFNVTDDTIQLDDDIFSSGLAANNSVAGSQFVIGAAALDAGDRIIYNSGTGAVYYDSDGTGAAAAIQFATLSPGLALTNHDFFVVA